MMDGMAMYRISHGGGFSDVRFFERPCDEKDLSCLEEEARNLIYNGFCEDRFAGKVGNSLDPFKVAETILAEHYGYAKMVKADYDWRPGIVY